MTKDEMLHWGSLVADLRASQIGLTHKQRHQFLDRFHVEIGLLCVWLNRLRITGGEAEVVTNLPETCGQCGIDLRLEGFAVDGATRTAAGCTCAWAVSASPAPASAGASANCTST